MTTISHQASPGWRCLSGLCVAFVCLIAGGGIKDMEGARRVLEQGADAVAIGTAAMKEAALCGDIQKRLK